MGVHIIKYRNKNVFIQIWTTLIYTWNIWKCFFKVELHVLRLLPINTYPSYLKWLKKQAGKIEITIIHKYYITHKNAHTRNITIFHLNIHYICIGTYLKKILNIYTNTCVYISKYIKLRTQIDKKKIIMEIAHLNQKKKKEILIFLVVLTKGIFLQQCNLIISLKKKLYLCWICISLAAPPLHI